MEQVQGALFNLFATIIVAAIGILTKKIVAYLDKKGMVETIMAKETSVMIAVDAIEQIARNEKVPDKFKAAKHMAIDFLNKQGIKVTDEELEILIESAVAEINKNLPKRKEEV